MEILVVILAALATLLVPLVLVMAEVAVLGASALVELAVFVWQLIATGSVDAARAALRSKRQASARLRRWAWWVVAASSGTLAVTFVALFALNFLCFDWFVRQTLRTAERQSGIAVTFAAAEGNLFTGRVALRDAKFVRTGHAVSDFDLSVAEFDVDADVWRLLAGEFAFDDVTVSGVHGQITRTGRRNPTLPRRRFTIERLTVDDVAIEFTDRSRPPREVTVPLAITSFEIADFRSWWAAFDLLFRSTCKGLLDGEPFTITSHAADDGQQRETQWVARNLPMHVLGGYLSGPLARLVDGRLDVDVKTRWYSDESDPELEMHCYVVAYGFAADLPADLAALQKTIIDPALAILSRSTARRPIEFDLTMQKDVFKGQLSPLAATLVEAFTTATSRGFPTVLPNLPGKMGERVERLRSRVRSMVEKQEQLDTAAPTSTEPP